MCQRRWLWYHAAIQLSTSFLSFITKIVTVQPYSFISCSFVPSNSFFRLFSTTYFILDIDFIKIKCTKYLMWAFPNSILYIQVCKIERLPKNNKRLIIIFSLIRIVKTTCQFVQLWTFFIVASTTLFSKLQTMGMQFLPHFRNKQLPRNCKK